MNDEILNSEISRRIELKRPPLADKRGWLVCSESGQSNVTECVALALVSILTMMVIIW